LKELKQGNWGETGKNINAITVFICVVIRRGSLKNSKKNNKKKKLDG